MPAPLTRWLIGICGNQVFQSRQIEHAVHPGRRVDQDQRAACPSAPRASSNVFNTAHPFSVSGRARRAALL